MGVAISGLAAGLARDGVGEAGNRGPVASQGLSALLAVAIKIAPDWSAEDEHRDSATDPVPTQNSEIQEILEFFQHFRVLSRDSEPGGTPPRRGMCFSPSGVRGQGNHDALKFPDGAFVLLTDLHEGQQATVLQLPAQPKTPAEAKAQTRVIYGGAGGSSRLPGRGGRTGV
jgi:hypothetical protein